jgi:hypothetical protein
VHTFVHANILHAYFYILIYMYMYMHAYTCSLAHMLRELARVLRSPGGRAVLLCLETKKLLRAVASDKGWRLESNLPVNQGGLCCTVLVLDRV